MEMHVVLLHSKAKNEEGIKLIFTVAASKIEIFM